MEAIHVCLRKETATGIAYYVYIVLMCGTLFIIIYGMYYDYHNIFFSTLSIMLSGVFKDD